MKYKAYLPDHPTIAGGWDKVGTIEAENEKELKYFLSAGQEGLTNCKVKGWKKVM